MRNQLPSRRGSLHFEFHFEQMKFHVSVSPDGAGDVREVFVDPSKQGSTIAAIMRDAAVAISIALQHGASVDEIREAMTRLDSANIPCMSTTAASPIGAAMDAIAEEWGRYAT